MENRILTIALLAAAIIVLAGSFIVTQAGPASLESQLKSISEDQKNIAQRLTGIENKLNALGKGGFGPQAAQARVAPPQPPAEDPNKVYTIGAGDSLIKGRKDAPVTIVEFSDFQCPFSQRFHPAVEEVLAAYPDNVNFVFKNFPLGFHPQAKPAAKAALAAREQGKYWEMMDLLFQNGQNLSDETFQKLAGQLSLDVERFMKDYKEKDAEWEKLIAEDMSLAENVDVRGTPTFYINGRKTNARDLNGYKAEIDKILSEKK